MMRRLAGRMRRFAECRTGNFAILGALSAVPLLLLVGGAVDLSMAQSRRMLVQDAADAAAIAAAKQFPVNPDPVVLAQVAQKFFAANVGDLYRTKATLVFDGVTTTANREREVRLHVDYAYDPIFIADQLMGIDGFGTKTLKIASAVMVAETTVEVAMVLDTSGSMLSAPSAGGEAKISALRRVAANAAKSFFTGTVSGIDKPTQIAIVPFSGAVNVGPNFLDAAWMDPKGLSPVHHENFDWKTYTDAKGVRLAADPDPDKTWPLKANPSVKLTRQYLYKNMKTGTRVTDTTDCTYKGVLRPGCSWSQSGTNWTMKVSSTEICTQVNDPGGCHPYKVSYTGNPLYTFEGCAETRTGVYGLNDAVPDEKVPASLFVPWFAPDEPEPKGDNDYLLDQTWKDPLGLVPLKDSDFLGLQRNINKYLLFPKAGANPTTNNLYTPGFLCDSDPILALSESAATVDAKIKSLVATGSTNVEEGIAWGWRVLSSKIPFAEGRVADSPKNIKAMILMTDGENTYYTAANTNKSRYGSHGFSSNERIFDQTTQPKTHTDANFTLSMEARTRKVCQNAKDDGRRPVLDADGKALTDSSGAVTSDGVIIYTIAFDIPAGSASRVGKLLTDCASYKAADLRNTKLAYASKTKYYYSAKNESELDAAFKDIMASLSKMRVSH